MCLEIIDTFRQEKNGQGGGRINISSSFIMTIRYSKGDHGRRRPHQCEAG